MQETILISKGGIVVAETQHKMVLSTTEPNNGINLVRIRQGDVLTQKFVVEVVEHGKLKTFDGLVPFFINTTKFGENQPVEQKVQEYSPAQARLVYTLSEPDWQWGGENTAHFSFRSLNGDGTWSEQFSTQDFTYRVISGISRSQLRDSGYVWTFEDLLRKFKGYMDRGKNDWEQFVEDNREILENIDPGGVLMSEMIESRGNYPKLPERLEDTDLAVGKVQNSNEDNLSAAFCFVDDDSKAEVYTVLKPIFDARNAKFSTAVITENIGTDRFMNSTQLKELAADGYEIMSHTANHLHLTQLTDDELTHELTRSKQMLIDWGFNPEYIMYPFGDFNDRVIKETRKYYKAAASTNHHNLNLRPVNTYSIGRVGVGIYGPLPLTFETVKEYVDQAIENKTLCCFMTHIAETPEENIPIIGQLIDYIQSLGYDVTTFGEAYKKHQNVLEYGDYPLTEKSQYLAVGAGGEIDPYFGRYLVNRPKESVLTKPITDYPQNFVTEEFIQTINAEGYPNDEPGILRTHRLTGDTEGDFREYVTLKSKKMYLSFWNKNTAAWGAFSEIGPDTSVDIVDKLNYGTAFTDPWTHYQKGKRHILKIPTSYSTSFPVPGNGGTLITENLIGEREFCWQLYHPVNSRDIFKRIPTSDSAWGAFKRVGDA